MLLATVLAVVAVFVWMVANRPPSEVWIRATTPATASHAGAEPAATRVPRLPSPQERPEPRPPATVVRAAPVAAGVPTPGIFDFGAMTPPPAVPSSDDDRFVANERFTQEDLQHPERYFEAAERMPELNRPEERRAVMEYFLAYRDKLERDLASGQLSPEIREEAVATLERYEEAIERLRELGAGER